METTETTVCGTCGRAYWCSDSEANCPWCEVKRLAKQLAFARNEVTVLMSRALDGIAPECDNPVIEPTRRPLVTDTKKLGYFRDDEVRLVRRKHRIGFRVNTLGSNGSTAAHVMALLKKVPPTATVDEVLTEEDNDDVITIEFHDEIREA